MPTSADPIGQNTYNGLGVPLFGESVIEQQNSSNTILTLVHSSAGNTGRFLLGTDYLAPGTSILTNKAVFDINEDGAFRSLSGTTVKMALNTSGLEAGTTVAIDTDGKFKSGSYRMVSTLTTVTATLSATNSGTLYYLPDVVTTSFVVNLPKNPTAGTWFEFYISSQTASSDVKIDTTVDSSAKIVIPGLTSAVSTARVITGYDLLTGSHAIRLTAISSILWLGQPFYDGGTLTTNALQIADFTGGRWVAANVVA